MTGDPSARTQVDRDSLKDESVLRLLDALPQIAYLALPGGQIEFVNQSGREFTGLSFRELRDQGWMSIVHPDDRGSASATIAHSLRSGMPYEAELRFRRADGIYRWHTLRAAPVRDEQGTILYWAGTCADIHAARTARERVVASERRYRSLADSIPHKIWTVEPSGRFDYFNQQWYDYTGLTFATSEGLGWMQVIHSGDVAAGVEAWQRALESGEVMEVAMRLRRAADGAYRWHLTRTVPVRNHAGAIVKWLGTTTDVHDQTEAAEALRASEERYRSLVTATAAIVWSAGPCGEFEMPQPSWNEYTGQAAQASLGWDWVRMVHPDDRQQVHRLWEEALERKAFYEVEVRLWHAASRHYRYCLVRAVPVLQRDDSLREWVGSVTDIHDRRCAEKALEEANAALRRSNEDLGQFASVASHDLREPLRTIGGFTELLVDRVKAHGDPDVREFGGFITDGVSRMQQLIEDLLSYSRLGASRTTPFRVVDLGEPANDALENLRAAIQETNAEVHIAPLPTLPADSRQMTQLFQNLIGNALKYRRAVPPRIEVAAERHGPDWVLHVKDNGIGIAPEHRDRVFGLFKRLHGRDVPGTGIGLALCKRIVERHGGRIWLESTPGQGSTFLFSLPAEAAVLPAAEPTPL